MFSLRSNCSSERHQSAIAPILADIALKQGETEVARQYAIRCHAALLQSEDGVIKQGLLELLAKHWPDVVAS